MGWITDVGDFYTKHLSHTNLQYINTDNPFYTEDKYNLSPVQLPDFAGLQTASLPWPAEQVSLQIGRGHDAPPASRLKTQMPRFSIYWAPFLYCEEWWLI